MPKTAKSALARERGESKTVSLGPNKVTFILSGGESGGKFSITEFEAAPPPAPGAPKHTHLKEDEMMYVLEGDFQLELRDRKLPAPAGSFVHVPKGMEHTIVNAGESPARLLIILSPPGFERYWLEMSTLLESTNGKPSPSLVLAMQKKYNMDSGGQARQFSRR